MRRSLRSRRSSSPDEEDLSDVAAWLYTDLLLGLAVVFIGGGAFIGKVWGDTPAKGETTTVEQPLTYQLSCDPVEFEVPQKLSGPALETKVLKEINRASKLRDWSEPKPGLVQVFGIDPNQSAAKQQGESFRDRTVYKSPTLKDAEIQAYADTGRRNIKNVFVRIFVVYKGQVKDNGCKN